LDKSKTDVEEYLQKLHAILSNIHSFVDEYEGDEDDVDEAYEELLEDLKNIN
jgi:hypothetical protein